MSTTPIHFLNGKFVEEKDLVLSVRDLGFTRGYAVFDFLITYQRHQPFMISRHMDRLFKSANLINLSIPWTKKQVHMWVIDTLAKNPYNETNEVKEKSIRIMISGGVSSSLLSDSSKTTIAILVDDRHELPREVFEKGVNIITVKFLRYAPSAKSNNYIEAVKNTPRANEQHAFETVYYYDTEACRDQVLEGATSNIFAVIKGRLVTPKTSVLVGVTRGVILDILKISIPLEIADFSIDELREADEVFLTASNKEILPVTKIDGVLVGKGLVGPITKEAIGQFASYVSSGGWRTESTS